MIESFLVYGLMIWCFCFFGIRAGNQQVKNPRVKFWTSDVWIILLVFAVFCGFRNNVGVDYFLYLDDYLNHNSNDVGYSEWLYGEIVEVISKLGFHYVVYFGIIAFIQLFFILYAFKDERFIYPYLLFVFMTNGSFFMWMNAMRQCVVISLFLFAVRYIKQREFVKFIIIIGIATMIHYTAIVLLPFYISFFSKDLFKSKVVQFILLGVSVALVNIPFWNDFMDQISFVADFLGVSDEHRTIEERFSFYEDVHYRQGFRFYSQIAIGSICIFYSDNIKKAFDINLLYNLFFVGLLSSVLFYNCPPLARGTSYFIYLQFVVVAYTLVYLKRFSKESFNMGFYWLIIVLLLLYFLVQIASNWYTQYYFFWQKAGAVTLGG